MKREAIDLTGSESDSDARADRRKSQRVRGPGGDGAIWQPFYLTPVTRISSTHNDRALGFDDFFAVEGENTIEEVLLMSYVVDLAWVATLAPHLLDVPTVVLHGSEVDSAFRNEKWVIGKVDMGLERFGTHHSKIALIFYQTGLRVVISTANFYADDFTYRTQGSFVQDFPRKPSHDSSQSSMTDFERDLTHYLERINISGRAQQRLQVFLRRLQQFDFSSAEVVLVASIPGRHVGLSRERWGLGKLEAQLKQVPRQDSHACGDKWSESSLVMQCSSLGSMGKDGQLIDDMAARMSPAQAEDEGRSRSSGGTQRELRCMLVWPTVECIQQSLQGYVSGNHLPCSGKNLFDKSGKLLPGFQNRLYRWNGTPSGRQRATPHMKTYFRYALHNHDVELAWLLLSSSNMSQAAWGVFQTKGSQLYIKSYEMGVLFLPHKLRTAGRSFSCTPGHRLLGIADPPHCPSHKHLGSRFVIASNANRDAFVDAGGEVVVPFEVPFEVPPEPYGPGDQPWVSDRSYAEPDCLGNFR